MFRDAQGHRFLACHAWPAPRTNYEVGGFRSLHIRPLLLPPLSRTEQSQLLGKRVRVVRGRGRRKLLRRLFDSDGKGELGESGRHAIQDHGLGREFVVAAP